MKEGIGSRTDNPKYRGTLDIVQIKYILSIITH